MLIDFRELGRKREGEKHWCGRQTFHCLSHTLRQGLHPGPFSLQDDAPTKWVTPARTTFLPDRLFHPLYSHLPLYLANSTHSPPLTSSMASSGRPHNQAPVISPHSTTVSASSGCCDKWPPMGWLKTTHLFSPSSEGQRSAVSFPGLKSRREQRCLLLRLWGEDHFLAFFSFHSSWPLPRTFPAHHSHLCCCVTWSSVLTLTFGPPSRRDSKGGIWFIQITQDNLSISKL